MIPLWFTFDEFMRLWRWNFCFIRHSYTLKLRSLEVEIFKIQTFRVKLGLKIRTVRDHCPGGKRLQFRAGGKGTKSGISLINLWRGGEIERLRDWIGIDTIFYILNTFQIVPTIVGAVPSFRGSRGGVISSSRLAGEEVENFPLLLKCYLLARFSQAEARSLFSPPALSTIGRTRGCSLRG